MLGWGNVWWIADGGVDTEFSFKIKIHFHIRFKNQSQTDSMIQLCILARKAQNQLQFSKCVSMCTYVKTDTHNSTEYVYIY